MIHRADAIAILSHWRSFPPPGESLARIAQAHGWRAQAAVEMTEEEGRLAHQRSLEERWAAGAMNAKQMFEAMGGSLVVGPSPMGQKMTGRDMPGIGPFPGGP